MLFTHLRVVTVHFTAFKGHGNAIIAFPFFTANTAPFCAHIHIVTASVFAFKRGVTTTAHIDNSSAVTRIAASTACNCIESIIGYTDRTIRWHIDKGRIFAIIQDRKYLVSKYSLKIKRNEAASSLVSE